MTLDRRWRRLGLLAVGLALLGTFAVGWSLLAGGLGAPIVIVTFEDLPLAPLLDEAGDIDALRFPAVAELASTATWYRTAITPSDVTEEALGALLSGQLPPARPEASVGLCAAVRSVHWQGPPALCPGAGRTWVDANPEAAFDRFLRAIGGPSELVFLHSSVVAAPWRTFADGRRYPSAGYPIPGLVQGRWGGETRLIRQGRRRADEQLAVFDRQLGRLLDRLAETGVFDRVALVVGGTRGLSFRSDERLREISDGNLRDVLRVPLWIKLPGQKTARVEDRPASLIDVVPTLLDAPRRSPSWPTEGVSLLAPAGARALVAMGGNRAPFAVGQEVLEPVVAAPPCRRDPIVGARLADLPAPTLHPTLRYAPLGGGRLEIRPGLVAGRVVGPTSGPIVLALAVGGRIVDTTDAFGPRAGDRWWSFFLTDRDLAAAGASSPRIFQVDGGPGKLVELLPSPPISAPSSETEPVAGYVEAVTESGDRLVIRGWAKDLATGGRLAAIEVYDDERLLTTFRDLPEAADERFRIAIPHQLAPSHRGLRLAAVTAHGERSWLGNFYRLDLGADGFLGRVERTDGWEAPLRPGHIVGAVESAEIGDGRLVLSGWAVDRDALEPAWKVLLFRDFDLAGGEDVQLPRPDVGVSFRTGDVLLSGFSIEISAAAADRPLRVVALGGKGRSAAVLPVLATVPAKSGLRPRIQAPRLGSTWLDLDGTRALRLRKTAGLGFIDGLAEEDGAVVLSGWAVDELTGSPPFRIHAFLGRTLAASPLPELYRHDVADELGLPTQAPYGFSVRLPIDVDRLPEVRVVVVSEHGDAARIPWAENLAARWRRGGEP